MKPIHWLGTSYHDLCGFPESVRKDAGFQLHLIQVGGNPLDWRPMSNIGASVREVRIHKDAEHRIIYVAKYAEAVYVLHVFQKKTQKTEKRDIDLAKIRFRDIETLRKAL